MGDGHEGPVGGAAGGLLLRPLQPHHQQRVRRGLLEQVTTTTSASHGHWRLCMRLLDIHMTEIGGRF